MQVNINHRGKMNREIENILSKCNYKIIKEINGYNYFLPKFNIYSQGKTRKEALNNLKKKMYLYLDDVAE